jgi:translocator protein
MPSTLPPRSDLRSLVGFAAITSLFASLGSTFTARSLDSWYRGLLKPEWAPADSVFAPAWTIVFALIAAAGWMIWKEFKAAPKVAWALYALQLALNVGWSYCFFALRNPRLGLVEVIVLWVVVFANLIAFWRLKPIAGKLLVPYWAWVSFTLILNFRLWQLNPPA